MYRCTAVTRLDVPGAKLHQTSAELGIRVARLWRWRHELCEAPAGCCGERAPHDEGHAYFAVIFCAKRQREVLDDPTMPRRVSYPIAVSL